jgi:hypothetical protein
MYLLKRHQGEAPTMGEGMGVDVAGSAGEEPEHRTENRDSRDVATSHNTSRWDVVGTATTQFEGEATDTIITKADDTDAHTNTNYMNVAPCGTMR